METFLPHTTSLLEQGMLWEKRKAVQTKKIPNAVSLLTNLDGDDEAAGLRGVSGGGEDVLAGAAKVEAAAVEGGEVPVAPGRASRRARGARGGLAAPGPFVAGARINDGAMRKLPLRN